MVKNRPHPKPVLTQVAGRIDQLLEEWSGCTTAKQRITAPRVLRQLLAEGYQVGETTIKDYLREKRRSSAEVFIPLVYQPAEVAQADFFEVTVEIDGKFQQAWKFVMRLMYSGYDFIWLYHHCDQLAFLDAHVRAFNYFQGTPQRIVYDNLSAAVERRIGCERELTERFLALVSHYLFEPCFTRPGEGHDKGGVESCGKAIRLQHLTPVPRGRNLVDIAQQVLSELKLAATTTDAVGRCAFNRFQAEQGLLRRFLEICSGAGIDFQPGMRKKSSRERYCTLASRSDSNLSPAVTLTNNSLSSRVSELGSMYFAKSGKKR